MRVSSSITYHWDGLPLPEEEHIQIDMHKTDAGLSFWIHAPYYQDPLPPGETQSVWALWNYEVVELFLVGDDMQYLEAEFGPHGHHLLLWLDAPRNITQKHLPVIYHTTIEHNRWTGEGFISSTILPDKITRWNLFSIHGMSDSRKYCCMKPLNTPKPDFHQPHQFPLFPETT